MQLSAFVISAPRSGSGKTTLSLGLMRALKMEGHLVRPFKCGPDYIDTQFHRVASGCESINLDTFMASEPHVRELFYRYSHESDVCVVEGAMGMFDGYTGMNGSCADIARLLDVPVVLLVDATATAYSVAATIYGFKHFREDIRIAGVVFNRIASPSHFSFLQEACADAGVECFGYMARDNSLKTPSRHLGLSLTAIDEMEAFVNAAAESVKKTVDIERLLEATRMERPGRVTLFEKDSSSLQKAALKIAVARDEAFNFIYPANIQAWKSHPRYDVSICYFSPLADSKLPLADIVYLPGGYPELYSRQLSENESMRRSVRDYIESGGCVLAECGGMIYLGREIDGAEMCGVLPLNVTMADARLSLGYRSVDIDGMKIRGHEFHYSRVTDDAGICSIANQYNAKGQPVATPLYSYKNCIAGYTHLYWAETDILNLWNL